MAFKDNIRTLIEEQGRGIFRESSIAGIMDDYGCFRDELPAVRHIFMALVRGGWIENLIDAGYKDSASWKFEIQNAIRDMMDMYGFSEDRVSNVMKEFALALGIISSEGEWPLMPRHSLDSNAIPDNEIWYISNGEGGEDETIKPNVSEYLWVCDGDEIQTNFRNKIISNICTGGAGVIRFENKLDAIWAGAFSRPDWFHEFVHNENTLRSITLPNSITQIEDYAFANSELEGIELPENLKTICDSAFMWSKLTMISLPNKVESIGNDAFRQCENLEHIVIPNSVRRIGARAFLGCTSLKSIVLPPIEKIEIGTFAGCSELESVIIPSGVKEIARHAFADCEKLTAIALPKTITRISKNAFSGCNNIILA